MSQQNARVLSQQFITEKLNDVVVNKIEWKKPKDTRPVRGYKLFPEMNANIFFCAKKNSGKTVALFKTLESCCGPDTVIFVFCATINKDPSWIAIKDWAKSKGIKLVGHTSIKDDDGNDQLLAIIKELEIPDEQEEEQQQQNGRFAEGQPRWEDMFITQLNEQRQRKSKYQSPDYIFVLDDISSELKATSIPRLLKVNRHFRCKTLFSSQWFNDLQPGSRTQMDYFIIFGGIPKKKLDEIHHGASISIPLEQFYSVYEFATKEKYSFLYVDCRDGTFRRNFNTLIRI